MSALVVAPDGEVWVGTAGAVGGGGGFYNDGTPSGGLLRWRDGGWDVVDISPLRDSFETFYALDPLGAATDRLWALAIGEGGLPTTRDDRRGYPALASLGPDGWTVLPAGEGADIFPNGLPYSGRRNVEVAPDGRIWYPHRLGGVASFDGLTETRYLADQDGFVRITDIAIDPDGTVWFVRDQEAGGGVFAIRP